MTKLAISPSAVTVELTGHARRWITARLPEGATADDARDPSIWRAVQAASRTALNRWDTVLMIAWDEAFAIEALVVEARSDAAVVSFGKLHAGKSRVTAYYADDTYAVIWHGGAFAVRRKSDGHLMATGLATEGSAITALQRLYPRVVA